MSSAADILEDYIAGDYDGDILLAGISYDRNAKGNKRKHTCMIEKVQ